MNFPKVLFFLICHFWNLGGQDGAYTQTGSRFLDGDLPLIPPPWNTTAPRSMGPLFFLLLFFFFLPWISFTGEGGSFQTRGSCIKTW